MNTQAAHKGLIVNLVATASIALAGHASASEATERVTQIQQQLSALQQDGARIGNDKPSKLGVAIGVDCQVKWNLKSLSFDLPKIEMRRQEWIYDLPETFWDITSIGPIKLHLPQFRMRRHTTKLDVPEFFMTRNEIKMHLPEFFCKNPRVQIGEMERRGRALETRAGALVAELKTAQTAVVREQLGAALKQLDDAIAGMEGFVSGVERQKGNAAEARAALQELRVQRARAIESSDQAIKELL